MAVTIKLKNASGSDPSASDLVVGEVAIRTDNGKLFTKKDNGSVAEISGGGGIDDGDKGDITVSNSGETFTIDNGVITGAKLANIVSLSDSQQLRFGDGNDLVIRHDGSNSILQENGTGNLVLKTNGTGVVITTVSGGQIAEFNNSGSCVLRHQTTERISTSGSGVSVTGNISVTGTVDGRDVATDGSKLDGIAASATNNGSGNAITDGDKGDITVSSSGGTFTIDNDVVTTAKMINFPTGTLLGRSSAGTGNATTLTASEVRSLLNVENGATADQSASEILTLIKTVDGAGSGLDADTLDGISSASFLRSDANDTFSEVLTLSKDTADVINFSATSTNNSRGIAFNSRTALSAHHNDGWLRLNNASEFSNGIYTPLKIRADGGINVDNSTVIDGSGNIVASKVPTLNQNTTGTSGGFTAGNASNLNSGTVPQARLSASTLLTLIKTVDGSGSGLDADTLDGISSASFVRSDANDSITGHLTITNDSGLKVRSSTNGNGAVINFSDHAGGSYSQNGSLTYKHGDGEVTTTGGNSNDGWLFEGSETRTVLKVVGDLEATQDIYGGTLVLNDSSDNQKIILQGTNDPYIRFREGTTNKAFIQWSSSGYLWLQNQEDNSVIVLRDNLGFSPDGGSTIHKIFHAGNDGAGTGLDADLLDGVQGSNYVRTNQNTTITSDLFIGGGAGGLTVNAASDISFTNGDWSGNHTKIQHHSNALYIVGGSSGIRFRESGTDRIFIDGSGHFVPASDSTYNIGSNSDRFANGYFDTLYGDGSNLTGISASFSDIAGGGTFTGDVTFDGATAGRDIVFDRSANKLIFKDDVIAEFGNSSNLLIYHDGDGSSYVQDNGTGDLILQSNSSIGIKAADENSVICNANGSVDLYHDNNIRLATQSSGIKLYSLPNNTGNGHALYYNSSTGQVSFSSSYRHVRPEANNTYDLGSTSLKWRNVYTNDLHLSNEGHKNKVDNTWGDYTIQEGESDLFLLNNRNGKMYKFMLQEVS